MIFCTIFFPCTLLIFLRETQGRQLTAHEFVENWLKVSLSSLYVYFPVVVDKELHSWYRR